MLFGLYGWALVAATGSGHDGVIGPHFNALGADWVIFLAAGRAVFSGELAHIYSQAWITSAVNTQFAHWLQRARAVSAVSLSAGVLLLVAPFALLPVWLSLALSQRCSSPLWPGRCGGLRRTSHGCSLLRRGAGAGGVQQCAGGTNAVLVAALIIGGVASLEKSRCWPACCWG